MYAWMGEYGSCHFDITLVLYLGFAFQELNVSHKQKQGIAN